jgi:hypothetical protein
VYQISISTAKAPQAALSSGVYITAVYPRVPLERNLDTKTVVFLPERGSRRK